MATNTIKLESQQILHQQYSINNLGSNISSSCILGDKYKILPSIFLQVLQGGILATKTPCDDVNPVIQWIGTRNISSCDSISYSDTKYHDNHNKQDKQDENGNPSGCVDRDNHSEQYNPKDVAVALSLDDWHTAIVLDLHQELPNQLARLALGVAFIRGKSRAAAAITPPDLAFVWSFIYGALTSQLLSHPLCWASSSPQGFLAILLCSFVKNGNIKELLRLHV